MTPVERGLLATHFGNDVQEFTDPCVGRLVVLPVIVLPEGCQPASSSGIFVANDYQGYPTRLFLDHPIKLRSGFTPSTTQGYLLGRTMHAASIGGVSSGLPLHQAILAHVHRYSLES